MFRKVLGYKTRKFKVNSIKIISLLLVLTSIGFYNSYILFYKPFIEICDLIKEHNSKASMGAAIIRMAATLERSGGTPPGKLM